jgi:hypothetical protein
MSKTIIVHDDRIDILKDGYNIIERTVYLNGQDLLRLLGEIEETEEK